MCEEIYETLIEEKDDFKIVLTAEPEYTPPQDLIDFKTTEQENEYLEKINNGEIGWFCAKIAVCKYNLELASEYLGGCEYLSLTDFKENSGYYEDLRDEAIKEAREKLREIVKGEAE